jgi:hypothetical protein
VVGCGETGNGILPLPTNPDNGYVSCDAPALVLSSLPAKDITMTNSHLFVLLENNSLIGMGETLPVPTLLSNVPYSTLFPPTDLQPFNLPMIPLLR